ncbi:fasciclin domain-containing protein [Allopontixanthobacter sp.]|uniref:fasciclin domain-containing protein n=1 Tax=Allopontixanthobacter sp. TaxID=2906452 RepID=UPI002ABC9D84|nr:fasciclin domain-containing protein [Allopontixanthobacter sp.]MDZ4306361.1 fasciclin domain-containing protein [Allopontixanthobacter sp.]
MRNIPLMLASAAALSLAACGQEPAETDTMPDQTAMADDMTATETGTIVDVASGNPDFATLVTAVNAADLGATLSGPGPFTVFAPNDAAFAKLPAGTLDDLTKPENKQALADILTYHVVSGDVSAEALTKMISDNGGTAGLTTVNGATLTAKVDGTNVILTDAAGNTSTVTATDVDASNGVIHVIDTVVMPS